MRRGGPHRVRPSQIFSPLLSEPRVLRPGQVAAGRPGQPIQHALHTPDVLSVSWEGISLRKAGALMALPRPGLLSPAIASLIDAESTHSRPCCVIDRSLPDRSMPSTDLGAAPRISAAA